MAEGRLKKERLQALQSLKSIKERRTMQQQKRSATGGPVVYFKGSEICYYNEER